jgi:hypothetical protein
LNRVKKVLFSQKERDFFHGVKNSKKKRQKILTAFFQIIKVIGPDLFYKGKFVLLPTH